MVPRDSRVGSQEDIFFFMKSFFYEITIARSSRDMVLWEIKQIKRLKFSDNFWTHDVLKSGKKVRFHDTLHHHIHRIPSYFRKIRHSVYPDNPRQIRPLCITQIRIL
ncbi:MAG: hypothetical protein ACD_78C00250G0002 [uncultured bacterium (gcode 4)]|uniref:Uncharacterized protein n=1 Tax=uncultured bacterium (gcode 4) TaxID=1234023 RepID=K1XXX2_9BACT|nr:MAG: hypothetical protein ACD_78C00250G0002 [uncultured bacterium (gcode 4)]